MTIVNVNCRRCGQPVEAGQLYTRIYVRNDWTRELTDQGEIYVSVHWDCPTEQTPT